MYTHQKFRKNAKALSPVIASIILIAITVAVSIAVAAWMGGLSIGFIQTEQLQITNVQFVTIPGMQYIYVNVTNTGASSITFSSVTMTPAPSTAPAINYLTGISASGSLLANTAGSFSLSLTGTSLYSSGNSYTITILTAKGNSFPYIAIATSSSCIIGYVPITITNTQTSATPNPFQENITWNPSTYTNYESSNLGNIRFYSDAAFTQPLYAWLESCSPSPSNTATSATAWVKLTNQIAENGGSTTIYMAFISTTLTFDDNYWGEAPNLSASYGQYDNGNNVFIFYDNFAGTTISSAWNTAGAAGTYSVNNGLTVNSYSFPGYAFTLKSQYTGPIIIDAYQYSTVGAWLGISFSNLQTTSTSYTLISGAVQWVYPPQGSDGLYGLCIASGSTSFTPNPQSTNLQVVTLAVNSTTVTEYQNYANPVTATGAISLTNYPGIDQVAWNPSDTQTTYWFRLRVYPLNNVMPLVSFGNIIAVS